MVAVVGDDAVDEFADAVADVAFYCFGGQRLHTEIFAHGFGCGGKVGDGIA